MKRVTSAASLLLAAALAVLTAAPAHAAGYRYWSFWDGAANGRWSYATLGPSQARPADGSVQGFRFDWEQMSIARARHPVLMAYMTRVLEFAVCSQARRFVTHTASSAEERLAGFRAEYPNLERRISQKVLASYLQITPAYLSQLMRREQEAA